jgi:hypothetical protein
VIVYVKGSAWKASQNAFEIGKSWRAKTQMELIHNDFYTMNQPSLLATRYILTFIDEFPSILVYNS